MGFDSYAEVGECVEGDHREGEVSVIPTCSLWRRNNNCPKINMLLQQAPTQTQEDQQHGEAKTFRADESPQ